MSLRHILTSVAAALICAATASAEPAFVPVYADNFPDAHIVQHNGEFIAYSTNSGINLPMLTSRDLVNWTPVVHPADPRQRLDGMPRAGAVG